MLRIVEALRGVGVEGQLVRAAVQDVLHLQCELWQGIAVDRA